MLLGFCGQHLSCFLGDSCPHFFFFCLRHFLWWLHGPKALRTGDGRQIWLKTNNPV